MARQVSIAFQDLAVQFSEDEWQLLGEGQRELYRDVMQENYEALASLGTAEPLPLSAFLSPTEPGGAMSRSHGEGQEEPPRDGAPGGAPQHSLHLTALVQLVKEIPGFLFGDVGPESRGASLDEERASPEAAVTVEMCPLRGLPGCLPDTAISRPGLATMPSGRPSSSGSPGARGQGSPVSIQAADARRPAEEEGPEAPGRERSPPTCSPPTCSPGRRKSHRKQERVAAGAGPAGTSPGNSPLQSLVSCLKKSLVPGPQHPEASPSSPPAIPSASWTTRPELGPGSLPWGVKTEAVSGDCPLQGLLNCLKEIPAARDTCLSHSGSGDPQLQEDPGAQKRNSGGPGPHQASPPCPGAVVKTEDGWAQSPPVPASCQLGKWTRSPSATGSPGDDGDTSGIRVPSWGPAAQGKERVQSTGEDPAGALEQLAPSVTHILPNQALAQEALRTGSASSSPLEALEACLKGIPLSGSLPPQPPTPSWFRSPQPGDPGSQRPELQPRGSHSQEVTVGPLLALGLQSFMRDSSALPPGPRGTPTSFSSSSSTDGDVDFQSPEGSQGRRPGKGGPVGSSPLQGLENCLREIPVPRPQPAWSWSSAGDRGPRRAEPKNWTAEQEGPRGDACDPVRLGPRGGDVPTRSLRPASPQALAPSGVPACCQQGLKDRVATRPGPWRWLQDGTATAPSPLHCLESSLKGILPGKPLRFACLAGPGPGPGPSSSSTSTSGPSSTSSSCSSEGDLRPEPEPWRPLPQERDPLPSSKGPGLPSPRSGGTPAGSSPGDGPRRAEPRDHFGLSAGAAASPSPVPRPEKRPGVGPCQPPGSAPGPLSWKPRVSEDSGGLGPGHGGPSVAAGTGGRPLPRGPPEPSPSAAVPPAWPPASPRPPCSCGGLLQRELHGLSVALSEKLDQLASALAGLSREVATMKTQVDRLGRRPRGPGPKGQASWPWALPRGPAQRHLPYWRRKGPTRPKPKVLRGQAEGLSHGTLPLVPPAEPSGPSSGPSQQPPYAARSRAVPTVHPALGHTGGRRSPPPPSAPAASPPQPSSPATSADAEPPAAAAAPAATRNWPRDPNGLLTGVQRALREELWGAEHGDLRWRAPSHLLHQLSPEQALAPAASPRAWPTPTARSSQTFPVSGQ